MTTLSQLRTRILNKLADGDITRPNASQVTDQINSTIDYYENDPFWFLESVATLTATVGDPVVTTGFPTDFKEFVQPNAVTVIDNDIRYPLEHITPLAFSSIENESLGLPQWYTYKADELKVFYYPDQAYSIELFYRVKVADLVNDNDTNVFTDNVARLIEYKTLSDLFSDYRSDFELSTFYNLKAEDEKKKVFKETYKRTSTGNLSTENIISRGRRYYR